MEPEGGEERRGMESSGNRGSRTVDNCDEDVMEMREPRVLPDG